MWVWIYFWITMIMTSERYDAHARFPHCACVKEKKRSKRWDWTTTSGSAGSGSDNWATGSSVVRLCQICMPNTFRCHTFSTFQVSWVSFPTPYLRLTSLHLWDRFFVKKKKRRSRSRDSPGKEVGINKTLIAEKRIRTTIFDISVLLHYWVVTEDPRQWKQ